MALPNRILEALDRVTKVLITEFPDLTPPDVVFIHTHLAWLHHEAFEAEVKLRAQRSHAPNA